MQNRNYELRLGDSNRELLDIPDDYVDGVLADPPYCSVGSASQASSSKYLQSGATPQAPNFLGDTRDARSWLRWSMLWLTECRRIAKHGSIIGIFTDWRMLPLLTDALQCAGWIWGGIVPWDKTKSVRPRLGGFRNQCEYVVWGYRDKLIGHPGVTLPGAYQFRRKAYERKYHQVGKPLELMRELVKIVPAGGLILDPFAGGASTGEAALLEGRRFLGIEADASIHSIALERLQSVT